MAKFGYQNDGQSSTTIPVGEYNRFAPGELDQGQTRTFLTGRVVNSFTVTFPSTVSLEWTLGYASVVVDIATARCQGDESCDETDNTDNLSGLDNTAIRQEQNVQTLVKRGLSLNVSSKQARTLRTLRAKAHELYLTQWTGIWGSFSKVTNTCTGCLSIDKQSNIDAILTRSREFRRLSRSAFEILASVSRGGSSKDRQVYEYSKAHHRLPIERKAEA